MYLFVCYLNEESLKGSVGVYYTWLYVIRGFRNACHFIHCFVSQWNNTIPFYITKIHPLYCDHELGISRASHPKDDASESCLGCNIFVALVNVLYFPSFFLFFFLFQRTIDQTFCTLNVQGFIWTIASSSTSRPLQTEVPSLHAHSRWWRVIARGGDVGSGRTSHESSFHFAKFSWFSTDPLGV